MLKFIRLDLEATKTRCMQACEVDFCYILTLQYFKATMQATALRCLPGLLCIPYMHFNKHRYFRKTLIGSGSDLFELVR